MQSLPYRTPTLRHDQPDDNLLRRLIAEQEWRNEWDASYHQLGGAGIRSRLIRELNQRRRGFRLRELGIR